ncbi:hypothetical protein [Mycolicibacterium diernhoferi]|uniref:Uncharacterized protein n=1 Tax=Mycolicibacterium diernhoferi TaxID=1801 RepID=A0A2A7NN46_9MYCO|nr:hypothetical protein [Mycolicibacterium diernhoferi]PEG51700.1 hypothetical protein CRI78_25455 [Mycolicibacterium diernhoferi]QYL20377.1 hypothetical protein K0O62_14765 [Mycolicibacterium diernhoferi]
MAQAGESNGAALSPFSVFSVLYTIAIAVEVGEQWLDPWFAGGFILAAGGAIITGMTRGKFLALLIAATTYFGAFRFPDVANHVNLMLCLNVAMIAVLGYSVIRRRTDPEADYTVLLPVLRLSLILVYVIAGFDKLNSDFFDPEASCATGMLASIVTAMQTRILGVPVVLPIAVAAVLGGSRLLRRGRFGTPGNRVFTVAVAGVGAAGLAAVVLILLAGSPTEAGLPPVIGMIAALSVISWELGGGLLLSVPRLQAGILAFSLTMHAALALIGFVDFGALALALLFTFVPADHLPRLSAPSRVLGYAGICLSVTVLSGWSAHVRPVPDLALLTGLLFDIAVLIAVWPQLAAVFSTDRDPPWRGVHILDNRTPAWLYAVPVLLLFIGMTPYLGLRTAGNFSMFSNLRTEGERSNHLLLGSNPIKMWGYQEDVVWILDIDDRFGATIYHYDGSPRGYALPVVEFRKWVHHWGRAGHRVPMTYAYDGYRHTTEDIVTDPVWRTDTRSPEMALLDFRYIQPGQPNYCRW